MADDPAEIAKAWQEAYQKATGKQPPCVEVRHTWIKIEGGWYCADEVRQRTEKLRQSLDDD